LSIARPCPFGLEAAEFVNSIHETIPLVVWDIQLDDEKVLPFDSDIFIANWMVMNHSAWSSIAKRDELIDDQPMIDSASILKYWNWNYFRETLEEELSEDVYIPPFYIGVTNDMGIVAPFWPNRLPVCLPVSEYILLHRAEEFLSESAREAGRELELTLVPSSELEHILNKYEKREFRGISYWYLNYADANAAPPAIEELFRNHKFEENVHICALDEVLDGTFFEPASAGKK
jgi:hypothetical protein